MKVDWRYIMIHHSLTKDTETVSWDDIYHFHTVKRGWLDIGYHAGIEWVAENRDSSPDRYEILLGRPLTEYGAHCPQNGMNRKAIGFMFTGNYDLHAPKTEMLMRACKYFIRPMMEIFDIPEDRIVGHNQYAGYKTCPGKLWDWQRFFSVLRQV